MMFIKHNPNVSQWTLDTGYKNSFSGREYPIPISIGVISLTFVTNKSDIDYKCSGFYGEFKVIFTTPGDALKVSSNYIQLQHSEATRILIKPELSTTSDNIRRYTSDQRKCFYQSERQLAFFRIYSQINCEEECLTNFTRNGCGCVKFSMPRDKNTRICGGLRTNCLKLAQRQLFTTKKGEMFRNKCNCMPACTLIKYQATIWRTQMDFENLKPFFGWPSESKVFASGINFGFDVKKKTRNETLSFADFLAYCGGLLGLFMGISVFSIIELVYFATIHLFWKIGHLRRANAVGPLFQTKD
ncbi:pickpocket protein 28-like [Contarinia nasturtii]|uniref:pickpocket protein 28-like n=1 Tax=Contarinia nasturtii TaxID=265458 RepID=UPI0012D4B4D5|nr:pickpocket protein 28-like [Contarinia nasturtii]